MAHTPLELYESAYRLQYHEKKIPEAIKIYEAIIREFPDSNECGYAVIQLQNVKATDIASALKKSASGANPLLVISFLFSSISFLVTLAGVILLMQQLRIEHHRLTLPAAALSKISSGKDESALKIIDELKKLSPRDVLPLELTSDIDRKHELDKIMAISPPPVSAPPRDMDTAAPPDRAMGAAAQGEVNPVKARRSSERSTAPVAPNRRSGKKGKNLFIVDPDSLSFF